MFKMQFWMKPLRCGQAVEQVLIYVNKMYLVHFSDVTLHEEFKVRYMYLILMSTIKVPISGSTNKSNISVVNNMTKNKISNICENR